MYEVQRPQRRGNYTDDWMITDPHAWAVFQSKLDMWHAWNVDQVGPEPEWPAVGPFDFWCSGREAAQAACDRLNNGEPV